MKSSHFSSFSQNAPKQVTPEREELQQRILALVEQLGEASDVAVWQASQPQFFPWQPYFQELKTLHREGQLQFEMLAPGQWMVRSLAFVQAHAAPSSPLPTGRRLTQAKLKLVPAPKPTKAPRKPASHPVGTKLPTAHKATSKAISLPPEKTKPSAKLRSQKKAR